MSDPALPIVLKSEVMQQVYQQVEQVAGTKATVLITGETGVGKDVIAESIHDTSPRKCHPFRALNCGTLDNGLIQSELFGHEEGAFTGATHQRSGAFELADQGTLFLDEVSEIPIGAQSTFLRVLEGKGFTRLGGNENIRVEVRVLTATNTDLETAIANHKFREDLYYRLKVFQIHVPALREHREDIPDLVAAFIGELSEEHGKAVTGISPAALNYLEHAPWPGNIRELKNVVEQSIILSQTDTVELGDLPVEFAILPESALPPPTLDGSVTAGFRAEVHHIIAGLSVTEFILVFGGIPNVVWQELPEKTQCAVIREASFYLSSILGGNQDAIRICGMDRDQILHKVAELRLKEHGSIAKAASSLGIDPRTLKTYIKGGQSDG